MTQDTFDRIDWLRRKLGELPLLILHIRDQALPSMQGSYEPRVSGSKEKTTAPLRLDPLDDADELWAQVCALAVDYAGRTRTKEPEELKRQWVIEGSVKRVHGFASSDSRRIYLDVVSITRYLIDHAFTLATNREYVVPVDELTEQIARARRKYPEAPEYSTARHRCPKCAEFGVEPSYSDRGELLELRCGHCGAKKVI